MEDVQLWLLVVQTAGVLGVFLTALITYAQMRRVQHQFHNLGDADRSRNVLQVVQYLESPEHLKARRIVKNLPKGHDAWIQEQCEAADAVARLRQVAAVYDQMGVTPEGWLGEYYGDSIVRSWETLEDFIEAYRSQTDRTQRIHFEAFATAWKDKRRAESKKARPRRDRLLILAVPGFRQRLVLVAIRKVSGLDDRLSGPSRFARRLKGHGGDTARHR